MLAVTVIGEPISVIAVSVVVAVIALFKGSHRLVVAILFGYVFFGINTLIKHLVQRTRPDTLFVEHMRIKSYSFPSGHAFGSMFFYGLLAYVAFTRLPHPWNLYSAILLGILIFLIGVSRVYLGAHFPSDVVVGWLFAGACLWLVIRFIKP